MNGSVANLASMRKRGLARLGAIATIAVLMLGTTTVGVAAASPPANDEASGATALKLNTPVEFNSIDATEAASDPDDCDGSHGPWPGPYFASVWFRFTAPSTGQFSLSSPTMQGDPDQFLAISFVYEDTGSGMTLVDCTAFGNDASWPAKKGQSFLIMEAGLSSAVTEEPEFSDKGGTGTIVIRRSANEAHYSWMDFFSYTDCGITVDVVVEGTGQFRLRSGKQGDPTPHYFDNYEWHIVSTNPDNGKWFREDQQALYRDLKITNVEGTIYTFVAQETGRPYTLTDMNGNRVYFDRGRLLTTFQVDTKGDDDLSNDEFIEGSFELLADNGDHPFWHFDGEWCDLVNELRG